MESVVGRLVDDEGVLRHPRVLIFVLSELDGLEMLCHRGGEAEASGRIREVISALRDEVRRRPYDPRPMLPKALFLDGDPPEPFHWPRDLLEDDLGWVHLPDIRDG